MKNRTTPTIADAGVAVSERTDDIAQIQSTVAQVESTQWNRDADGFMQLLLPHAVWVTAFGKRMTGWEEINTFTQKVLTPAIGNEFARYEVVHITFLSDDIAAVNIHQRPVGADDEPLHDVEEGRPLYVMTKSAAGNWRIAVGQNTKFQSGSIAAQIQGLEDRK